jgi:uncharacterized protein
LDRATAVAAFWGKANAELIELVAKHFGCRRSDVSIRRGASSRLKLVKIESV